ncbi:MAG: metallopeptidase family protein [bacterium]|nr:metallopeptidase family protein [bacterium]
MELEPEGIAPVAGDPQAGRSPALLAIEGLLDEERFDEALAAINTALAEGAGNELDLTYLAGDAWLGLGRPREAEERFRAVLAIDPDCPASRCWLALALFLQWRFDEAEAAVQAALELPETVADIHVVKGALLERHGKLEAAESCFTRAHEQSPAKHPLPVRLSREEFDREVSRAANRLPRQFRQALDRVAVVIENIPEDSLLDGPDREELAPDMLGLFDGTPLPETSGLGGDDWKPNRIFLFQRNLERVALDREDLADQIRITLWHELGHYLGFEEEDMGDLGLE